LKLTFLRPSYLYDLNHLQPPPQSKAETKWEKFAKLRGIPVNKSKRSQKVWDEAEQEWKFRHGYNKANSSGNDWPIMEVGANDDPFEDPWERMREGKRGRVEKNLVSRMKNEEKAGTLPKGTAKKTVKAIEKARTVGKGKGNKDTGSQIPVGVPVDLKARKGSEGLTSLQRGRENTHKALLATQRSTASMGKFDGLRDGEPEKKKTVLHGKKRKFESSTDKKVIASESDRGLKVLDSVMNGGGKERDRAKRKGSLAKGETAFDYDFDDGLGPSTFKKKKGRAGAGKMKKMTKKRTK
jgi:regulator of ribosome biosynthesis